MVVKCYQGKCDEGKNVMREKCGEVKHDEKCMSLTIIVAHDKNSSGVCLVFLKFRLAKMKHLVKKFDAYTREESALRFYS